MKIIIKTPLESAPGAEGKTLLMVRSIRGIADFQRASGWTMEELKEQIESADVLGVAVGAFFALSNAGFTPSWDEILSCDPDDFEPVKEPGDRTSEADVVDPSSSLEDSGAAGVEGASKKAAPASMRSSKPRGGSKTK